MSVIKDFGTELAVEDHQKLKEPENYRVVLLNDDFTTMEFVVQVLVTVFRKSEADAQRIMLDVHRKGRGVVGVYTWDLAVTKAEEVHTLARKEEFPLRCVVEKA
jgi:ATP-dependent Clp protease adaptor protein ClpS